MPPCATTRKAWWMRMINPRHVKRPSMRRRFVHPLVPASKQNCAPIVCRNTARACVEGCVAGSPNRNEINNSISKLHAAAIVSRFSTNTHVRVGFLHYVFVGEGALPTLTTLDAG